MLCPPEQSNQIKLFTPSDTFGDFVTSDGGYRENGYEAKGSMSQDHAWQP